MELLDIVALLVTISALLSYVNYRYLRLPTTIGLMIIALLLSLALLALGQLAPNLIQPVLTLIEGIDFKAVFISSR